jgi:inner membrane protein
MDPLTHTLLGAVAGHAVANRRLPRSAWVIGLLAGGAPDLDVLISPASDPLGGLIWHRHFTHALPFVPIGAAAIAGLAALVPAWRRHFGATALAALAGMATHGLCDALTSYGTLLAWPFSDRRVQWDVLPIIDPMVTVPLLVALAVAVAVGWRGGGQRSTRSPSVAVAGLLVISAYAIFASRQGAVARDIARTLAEERGHEPLRLRAMPQPASVFLWRTIYDFEDEYGARRMQADLVRVPYFAPERATVRVGTTAPIIVPKEVASEGLDEAMLAAIVRYNWFTDDWMTPSPDDPRVLNDGRYAPLPESFRTLWGLVLPDAEEALRGGRAGFRFDRDLRRSTADALLAALRGDDPLLRPVGEVTRGLR